MYTSTTDIPNLAFLPNGSYDLSTPERKLAACEAALYHIANTIPMAYHNRGPEFVRDQIQRNAVQLVQQLRLARKPADGVMDLAAP
jgi:hypothetical protein